MVIQVRNSLFYAFRCYIQKNVLLKHKVYLSVLQSQPIGDTSKRKEGSLQPDSLISVNPNK